MEAGSRGSLTIAQKVVEKVAVVAASQVDGVADIGSVLERTLGRDYPRAEARVAGDRVRLSVDIAVVWPAALPSVAVAVRDAVSERVSSLVGLQVDAVDVTAGKVVQAQPRQTRRVR